MADKPPTFDTGLDRSSTLSKGESERLAAWYAEQHGTGDLSLVPFVTLLVEHRPDVMKHHRFVAQSKHDSQHFGPIVTVLLFTHLYTIVANEEGILYEIIAARKAGATKAEVLDVIAFAYLHGGTNGLNAVGKLSDQYLRDWTSEGRELASSPWPAHWAPDPDAFRSGIEQAPGFSASDLSKLEAWYRSVGSELPAYVRLLAKHRPQVLKEYRRLQEAAVGRALPKQMVPLMLLHLSVVRANLGGIRFAAKQAQAFGVTRDEFLDTVCWSMSYSGELGLQAVGDLLSEIVDSWPMAASR